MPNSANVADIVQKVALQLDGIGLSQELLSQAVTICERDLEKVATTALRSVLIEHVARLKARRNPRKPRKHFPLDASDNN